MIKNLLVVICALSAIATAQADQLTLPQMARRSAPRPVYIERGRELVPVALEEIVATADLIVHGTVAPVSAYLSDDEKELYTDYAVTPLRVILQRGAVTSQAPELPRPIIVKHWGGHTVIEGVDVSLVDTDLPPFANGAEVVLVLKSHMDGKYRISKEVAGVLGVSAGRIATPVSLALRAERFTGLTIAQFESEVRRLRP
jgi:hypothetical protein